MRGWRRTRTAATTGAPSVMPLSLWSLAAYQKLPLLRDDMLRASCIAVPNTLHVLLNTPHASTTPLSAAAGWLLDAGMADTSKYKYFIFMNSSVRGPFIPPYARVGSGSAHRLLHGHAQSRNIAATALSLSCVVSPAALSLVFLISALQIVPDI